MSWAMVAGAAVSVVGGALTSKGNKAGSGAANPGYYDPYAPYRGAAATQLNNLMANYDPNSNPVYKAMMDAAGRTSAAQGYNGSGNALVAAANAGGQAYQQQFNNLAMLSGASYSPAQAGALAAQQGNYNQQMNNQMWGGIGSIFGRLGPSLFGGSGNSYSLDQNAAAGGIDLRG